MASMGCSVNIGAPAARCSPMLSYRHAFHAGNHADVLKHFVLRELLKYFKRKEKPFLYVDTHAGAGRYALDSEHAKKNTEYRDGIGRLWARDDLPPALGGYVGAIRAFNREASLRFYPGSPAIAEPLTRAGDQLRLCELHVTDFGFLKKAFDGGDKRIRLSQEDGFAVLRSVLPPPSRRALVLIDPPYERREDYRAVLDAIKDGLRRFPGGTYALWYPRLQKTESKQLVERLCRLKPPSWLQVWLDVQRPSRTGFGLHGSGLFVINPPYTLPATLEEAMPTLVEAMGQDDRAGFGIDREMP